MKKDNQNIIISIIGMGPRGLNIFERIHSHCIKNTALQNKNIILLIFNDNENYGAGCHDVNQSENLLVNTICSQITTFSDESVANYNFSLKGPSFYEWLQAKYKDDPDHVIDPLEYYSRKDLGEYLCWSFNYIYSIKVKNLKIFKVADKVIDISKNPENDNWNIYTKDSHYLTDFIFITTGHDDNHYRFPNENKFYAYPLENTVKRVKANSTVAIQGLGLTTIDVVAELTENKGGKFVEFNGALKYVPSGKEPRIIAFSRSGLPLNARGKTQKELREQYKPKIFTKEHITELKKANKRDFQKDYLPLLLEEMEYVYSYTFLKKHDIIKAYNFMNDYIIHETQRSNIVKEYIPDENDRFSWDRLSNPLKHESFNNQNAYKRWLLEYLHQDIRNAIEGNVDNPIKASTDVLRDVRDLIRFSVDHGSLTEESAIWFNTVFIPIMNRICVGPPLKRVQQLVALIEAGIVEIDLGPNVQVTEKEEGFHLKTIFNTTYEADYYIVAKVCSPAVEKSQDILLNNMLKNNIGSQFKIDKYKFGQFNVNKNFNLVNNNNEVIDSIYGLGIPTEGAKFYTFILPRPFVNSTALYDAEVCVNNMLSHIIPDKDIYQQ